MQKLIISALTLLMALSIPFNSFAASGVYVQNETAVIVPDSAKDGFAVAASYNNDGVMLGAQVSDLKVSPYDAQSISAHALGYKDKVFFLDRSYAPSESAFSVPYQGESDIPHGSIKLDSYPHGADMYIDGKRYENDTTPCVIQLPDGFHYYSYSAMCYENFDFWASLGSDESEISIGLDPIIPESDYTITVNDATPVSDEQVDFSDSSVTFREAVRKANSDPEHSYTIIFDKDIDTVCAGGVNNIEIRAKNLTINGLEGRDKNVIFDFQENVNRHYITVLPTDNFTVLGATFKNNCFVIRPDDNESATENYNNIKIVECRLENNEVFAFGGACKKAGASASVNYKNMYFCGNVLVNSNCFFAYSGDCDNSVADGIYYCSNLLDENSKLTVNCADCNTWYIYGRETQDGGITKPETSDGNTVRNILISGNIGGRILMSCAVGGNSNNLMENAVIRNNYTYVFNEYTCAQVNNVRNSGVTMHTDGNVMRNFLIAYNGEAYTDDREATLASRYYVTRNEYDALDGSSTLYCDNNKMENFVIHNNVVTGVKNAFPASTIGDGVEYKNLDENPDTSETPFCAAVENETPQGISYVSKTNNAFTGLTVFDNSSTEPYAKTLFLNKTEKKDAYALTYDYDNAKAGYDYVIMAVKGTPDNYTIDSDSLLYINQYHANSNTLNLKAVIPSQPYKGPFCIIITSNDGQTAAPEVIDSETHVHNFIVVSDVKATCVTEGKKVSKCSECGKEIVETTPKTNKHTVVKDKAVKPTFAKAGKTEGSHCSVCNKVIKAQKKIAKLKPSKTSLKKLTAGKGYFTATWKKQTKYTTGYQIQYCTKKNFKGAKKVTVKKNKKVKTTVKNLKKNKTYYVRIRTYKVYKNKKYYSAWSKIKSIKVK